MPRRCRALRMARDVTCRVSRGHRIVRASTTEVITYRTGAIGSPELHGLDPCYRRESAFHSQ